MPLLLYLNSKPEQNPALINKLQNPALINKQQNPPLINKQQNQALINKQQNPHLINKQQNQPLLNKQQNRPLINKQLFNAKLFFLCHVYTLVYNNTYMFACTRHGTGMITYVWYQRAWDISQKHMSYIHWSPWGLSWLDHITSQMVHDELVHPTCTLEYN